MTNKEKYKTPEERKLMFDFFCHTRLCEFCQCNADVIKKTESERNTECILKWLALETEDEKPRTSSSRMDTTGLGQMSTSSEYDFAGHDDRIRQHYDHAREKHPYFCDGLLPTQVLYTMAPGEIPSPMTKDSALHVIHVKLRASRERIRCGTFSANILWNELLDCEVWEAAEALANGDKAQAVEELYDCVAVCLRAIDAIEGRQQLGKPEGEK